MSPGSVTSREYIGPRVMPLFKNSAKCMVKKWMHMVKIIIFGKMMPSEILFFLFYRVLTTANPPNVHSIANLVAKSYF